MLGLESVRDALMGERPHLPPPSHDAPEDTAAILTQLQETRPTFERGQAWLSQARNDLPFLDHHRATILACVPALRVNATNSWIDLMQATGWEPNLDCYALVKLLAAMLAWEVAAAQRSLMRLDIVVDTLPDLVWSPLIEETERYLTDQTATDSVLSQLRNASAKVTFLIELGVGAPEAGETASDLIVATQTWCGLQDQEVAADLLTSQWRIADVAAIGVWYRAFGEQLQQQAR